MLLLPLALSSAPLATPRALNVHLDRWELVHPVLTAGGNHRRRLSTTQDVHATRTASAEALGAPFAAHAPSAMFELVSPAHGHTFTLSLERSDGLFADRFASTTSSTTASGDIEVASQGAGLEMCHYHGKIAEDPSSLVVGATCDHGEGIDNGLSAHIAAFGHNWVLRPLTDEEIAQHAAGTPADVVTSAFSRPHALFRHDDEKTPVPTGCGHDHHDDHHDHDHDDHPRLLSTLETLKTPLSKFAMPFPSAPTSVVPTKVAASRRRRLQSCSSVSTDYSAYQPKDGCTCLDPWSLTGSGITYCGKNGVPQCGNPDGDSGGPWCFTNEATCDAKWKYCEIVSNVAPTNAPVAAPTNSAASTGTGCAVGDKVFTPFCSYSCNENCAYTTTYSSVITEVSSTAIKISWDDGDTRCSGSVGTTYTHGFVYKNVNNKLTACSSIAPSGAVGSAAPTATPPSPTPYPSSTPASPTPNPTAGAPTTPAPTSGMVVPISSKHNVELLLINDYQNYVRLGSDLKAAKSNAVLIANMVRLIYEQLNLDISIVFVHMHTFTDANSMGGLYTSTSYSMETYLNRLSDWRDTLQKAGGMLGGHDASSDNTQLLAGSDYSSGTTGLAWVGTMCNTRTSCGIDEDLFGFQYTAQTVAHEMGHNWGSSHDGSGNSCDSSSKIMASSGCSNCGFTEKAFSQCSKSVIASTLQNLQSSGSANCLANVPTRYAPSPVCGDYVVSGSEDCDDGPAGSTVCTSSCTQKPGVQCSTGQCCDTSTGQFKSASSVCRETANSCDLSDYCSGSSNTCGSDSYKADGTTCTSGSSTSKCFHGACVSRSSQCGASMTGYTGTWVAGPLPNGGDATCANPASTTSGWSEDDECGELKCTNSEWDNGGCYRYDCPSGYTCTLSNGEKISGPSSRNQCNCIAHPNSVTTVFVADGTPCALSSGDDKICVAKQCVTRSSAQSATVSSNADSAVGQPASGVIINKNSCPKSVAGVECSARGSCDEKATCQCLPGFTGSACEATVSCSIDCVGALHRTRCVAADTCGVCLDGFATPITATGESSSDAAASACTRQAATPAGSKATGTHVASASAWAIDGDVETAWQAHAADSADATFTEPPSIVVRYGAPFVLKHYSITSAPTSPDMDPKDWMLHGRNGPNDEWTLLDHRTGMSFSARRETASFFPAHQVAGKEKSCSEYKMTITDVRSAAAQRSGATVVLTSGSGVATSSNVVVGGVKPKVQVGEVAMMGDVGNAGVAASASASAPPAMSPGVTAFLVILAIGGGFALVALVVAGVVVGVIVVQRQKNSAETQGTELTSHASMPVGVPRESIMASVTVQQKAGVAQMAAIKEGSGFVM